VSGNGRRRVAITGVGAITPIATGVEGAWDGILAGRSGIDEIQGFDTAGHRVRIAGEVLDFDAADWLDAKDVRRLDRFCHFALVTAGMAIGDAGFVAERPERVATVYSSGIGGVRTIEDAFEVYSARGPQRAPATLVPASIPNMAAGQIAMRNNFGGPSTCPVTACASSADAVGWGYRLVRDGYADACLAGGSEACVRAGIVASFANLRALSTRNDDPAAASRPFDAERDGFALSEGAGALMLEPLDTARARGAAIYAEVCGYGQSSDAYHETAPAPDGTGAARAITAALEEADVRADEVDYVNAHGTSTPLLDKTETKALKLALGESARAAAISSTKSMTGHLLGAAGAVETIFSALALRDQIAPPTINLETHDPECDLDYVPAAARRGRYDVALSNSMGFGGHNVCLVLRSQVDGAAGDALRTQR
jgi:3-oxoacyl-[acyl-carrier-protein] synthase II